MSGNFEISLKQINCSYCSKPAVYLREYDSLFFRNLTCACEEHRAVSKKKLPLSSMI
jgi:hypothetical protein